MNISEQVYLGNKEVETPFEDLEKLEVNRDVSEGVPQDDIEGLGGVLGQVELGSTRVTQVSFEEETHEAFSTTG